MKLIVKIGLIALLVMLNYQGVDADVVSSAIDRYATTTESQENTPSDMVHWNHVFHYFFADRTTAGIN